ncbi:hypothetical protein FG386_001630 [Cryptosporidium ryanae]|uniref:uncharacterized protein n=1 Tax=Cryptosporidium ryanae TaxID=515981 RepID=UPI00351A262F|nr:hypothetical protein FG386_001630 [Cryptosporidium ryanae]
MKQRRSIEPKNFSVHKFNSVSEHSLEGADSSISKLNKKVNFKVSQKTGLKTLDSLPKSFTKDQNRNENNVNSEFAVFLLILIGNEIELKLRDGKLYRGIFQSLDTKDNEIFICIQYCARIFNIFSDERSIPIERYKIFPLKSISRFFTTNMNGIPTSFDTSSEKVNRSKSHELFKTDIEIGQTQGKISERILQPWTSEEHGANVIEDVLGETPITNWDQFEENRIKFGVEGTYDETLYTTPLNYENISEEEKRKAELLAKEIESNQRKDHIYFVENNVDGLNTIDDEEMNFSSVYRETDDRNKVSNVDKVANDGFNNVSSIKMTNQNEISDKDSVKKATSKTNFSFNPNAKEFQPRCLTKPNISNDYSIYGYGGNPNLVQVVESPLFMDYHQVNHFYRYPSGEQEINFQHKLELGVPKGQYDIKALNVNPILHNESIKYESNTGEFVARDIDTNQHIRNTGYFIYDGSKFNEYHNLAAPKNYPIPNRLYNYNNSNHSNVYYFRNRSQNSQSYLYYQVSDPRNWNSEY